MIRVLFYVVQHVCVVREGRKRVFEREIRITHYLFRNVNPTSSKGMISKNYNISPTSSFCTYCCECEVPFHCHDQSCPCRPKSPQSPGSARSK